MALTDEQRLQMTAIALMRYSVSEKETKPHGHFEPYEVLKPSENVSVSYSYTIE